MNTGFTIGYLNFTIVIMLLSGLCILRIDTTQYRSARMQKETRVSRVLGWFNMIAAVVLFVGNWLVEKML